jgi:hypothetical protein
MCKRYFVLPAITFAVAVIAIGYGVRFGKGYLHRRALTVQCINCMVAIELAARMWANDHNEQLPADLLSMSNELVSPKILHCPGDDTRRRVGSWAEFADTRSSYEIVSRGAQNGDTNAVYLRCRVHGHLGYADATVFDGKQRGSKRFF